MLCQFLGHFPLVGNLPPGHSCKRSWIYSGSAHAATGGNLSVGEFSKSGSLLAAGSVAKGLAAENAVSCWSLGQFRTFCFGPIFAWRLNPDPYLKDKGSNVCIGDVRM